MCNKLPSSEAKVRSISIVKLNAKTGANCKGMFKLCSLLAPLDSIVQTCSNVRAMVVVEMKIELSCCLH